MNTNQLYPDAVSLLKQLISTPSFSKEEDQTAALLCQFLEDNGIEYNRSGNNVRAVNKHFDANKPTILLNSHHDTVKPNKAYTRDPFVPTEEEGRLYGLGSNDAGGCVVSLLAAFRHFYEKKGLRYNLAIAITAEEENSGNGGIESILAKLPENIEFAIVGEPTLTNIAVAEKGLMVLDCVAQGKAGHAAREEGDNAIYHAVEDIQWFKNYQFPKISETLGPIKMTVSVIHAGELHNMVPSECHFTVDIRVTDAYTHENILEIIKRNVNCEVAPRSTRLRSSSIDKKHPIVQAGLKIGKETYGSPTTSDQALIPTPSIKMGPGDSARSHSANEYIWLKEIRSGIVSYISMLEDVI